MANIPCSNPQLCGVQSHRPGTYAPCHQPTSGAKGREHDFRAGPSKARMSNTPQLATAKEDVSDYRYTPTDNRRYGDDNYVPVTDLAIELSREHGIVISPNDAYEFSFEGYDSDENEVTITINSKRDRVWIEFDGEGEGEASEFTDKYEAAEWMNEIFSQYGKQTAEAVAPEPQPEYGAFDPEKNLTIDDLPESLDEEFVFEFDLKGVQSEFYVNVTGFDAEGKAQYEFDFEPDGRYDEEYREALGEFIQMGSEDDAFYSHASHDAFDSYFQKLIQENYADEIKPQLPNYASMKEDDFIAEVMKDQGIASAVQTLADHPDIPPLRDKLVGVLRERGVPEDGIDKFTSKFIRRGNKILNDSFEQSRFGKK